MNRLMIVLVVTALTGCGKWGYRISGNEVHYLHWNAGHGQQQDKLGEADAKSFTVLKHRSYAKDKQHVFYEGYLIKGADAASFESVGAFYAKDKNRGYYGGAPVEGSKGQSFRIIDGDYSTDGTDVFFRTSPLGVCSAEQFRYVYTKKETKKKVGLEDPFRWTTDGCAYYYNSYKIPSSDYANVTLYKNSGGLSKDKQYVYIRDQRINYNDKGEKLFDVDPASFTVTDYLECRDKDGCINALRKERIACR